MSIFFLTFVVLPVLMTPVLLLWALVAMLRRRASQWEAAGQERLVWAIVVVFFAFIGPLLYLFIGHKQLAQTAPAPGLAA